jgi:2-oxoisovalerate dehydrogenase E1 component beta subunit
MPSTPADAKGLLLAAIRDEDPVIFLEPKALYRTATGEVPTGDYTVPIGPARLVRAGTALSLLSWGAMVPVCEKAADLAMEKGIACEIVDLRSLVPLDLDTILASVQKTGRVVIVCEAPRTGSYAGEIAALIAEHAIESLEGPILRVTGYDTPFPYALEHTYLPSPRRVLDAIERVVNF